MIWDFLSTQSHKLNENIISDHVKLVLLLFLNFLMIEIDDKYRSCFFQVNRDVSFEDKYLVQNR